MASTANADQAELFKVLDRVSVTFDVTDPEVLSEVLARSEGAERQEFLAEALRLGVFALRMANGRIDATVVKDAGDILMRDLREVLSERGNDMAETMKNALRDYFDPESGMVAGRLRALVEKDGDISRVLSQHVGGDESTLAKTLASHVGEGSPLFKMLSPNEASGLQQQIEKGIEETLGEQRETILKEFSLDQRDSALRRLIGELEERHKALKTDLAGQLSEVVGEFSLDKEDSALSRLVGRVEAAQRTITGEFSLDKDDSALSRLNKMIVDFRQEVSEKLTSIHVQREEISKSPTRGVVFEDALCGQLSTYCERIGDIAQSTGSRVGAIKNCKVGDIVIELGPESPAPKSKIVWEAKDDQKYDLRRALAELDVAKKNRGAQVGVFVFSESCAPPEIETFSRFGSDIVLRWQPDSPMSHIVLKAALSTSRALCIREQQEDGEVASALHEADLAARAIEKQIRFLDDMRKMAATTESNGRKISDRALRMAEELSREVERLDKQLELLRLDS